MLSRQHRLASSRDFKIVFADGRTYVHRLFILKVLPTAEEQPSRFAFSTSAKLGSAVVRNRAKRLLREAVRLLGSRVKQRGRDAVLIARPPMRDAKLGEVLRAVEEQFQKAGLLEDSERT
ncbi:MAG TPA: ribonuclease P protein component [Armatimonadota bacterium]|nr:ribonuclease P protein component [Armatimonadota bacterium]